MHNASLWKNGFLWEESKQTSKWILHPSPWGSEFGLPWWSLFEPWGIEPGGRYQCLVFSTEVWTATRAGLQQELLCLLSTKDVHSSVAGQHQAVFLLICAFPFFEQQNRKLAAEGSVVRFMIVTTCVQLLGTCWTQAKSKIARRWNWESLLPLGRFFFKLNHLRARSML